MVATFPIATDNVFQHGGIAMGGVSNQFTIAVIDTGDKQGCGCEDHFLFLFLCGFLILPNVFWAVLGNHGCEPTSPLNLKLFCDPRIVFQFAFLNVKATGFHGFIPSEEHAKVFRIFPTPNASNIDSHDFFLFVFVPLSLYRHSTIRCLVVKKKISKNSVQMYSVVDPPPLGGTSPLYPHRPLS